jgi:uncharacterized protein YggE
MKAATILIGLAVIGACGVPARAQTSADTRGRITASGDSLVYVTPDRIEVALGIETRDTEIIGAKQKNNDILKRTLAAIKELGVAEKDVQTDQLSIEPRYRNDYNQDVFLGYFVRNTLVVTVNDTGKVEDLLSKALQAGVNYVHGVTFQTSALRKYRDQARDSALKAAKEKADAMARALGQSVGAPVQITENSGGAPWSYYSGGYGWGYGRAQLSAQNYVQDARGAGGGESGETIALGKIAVRASVSVVFELQR